MAPPIKVSEAPVSVCIASGDPEISQAATSTPAAGAALGSDSDNDCAPSVDADHIASAPPGGVCIAGSQRPLTLGLTPPAVRDAVRVSTRHSDPQTAMDDRMRSPPRLTPQQQAEAMFGGAAATGAGDASASPIKGKDLSAVSQEDDFVMSLCALQTIGELRIEDVSGLAQKVGTRLQPGELRRLTITGHGMPGSISIGGKDMELRYDPQTGREFIALVKYGQNYAVEDIEAKLAALKPFFAADGLVDFESCNLAATYNGRAFLQRLADIFGVPVRAGTTLQSPIYPGHEGNVVTCTPANDGRIHSEVTPGNPVGFFADWVHNVDYEGARSAGDKAAKRACAATSPFEAAQLWLEAAGKYGESFVSTRVPVRSPRQAAFACAKALVSLLSCEGAAPSSVEREKLLSSIIDYAGCIECDVATVFDEALGTLPNVSGGERSCILTRLAESCRKRGFTYNEGVARSLAAARAGTP